MNLAYCLAAAAYDKQVKLAQFAPSKLKDPKILALMHRIKIAPQKDLTDLNKEDYVCLPGRVTVKTKDGREVKYQLNYAKDSRGNRATRAELQDKFFELARPYIGDSRARKIISMVYDLEKVKDIGEMAKLCKGVR
jgi:2-methylcitrate dehydratase